MVGIAVIGCGRMGRTHASNIARLEGLSLRGCCDVNLEMAREVCSRYGGHYWTTDPQRVMTDDSIDAVVIATLPDSHPMLVELAARAGKHVFVEKPLALTSEHCLRIEDIVRSSGIRLMLDFKFRFSPAVRRAHAEVPSPVVGHGQVMARRLRSDYWGLDPGRGGGFILEGGCHVLDLICWLHGCEPEEVYAQGKALIRQDLSLPDTAVATVRFKNGSFASIMIGAAGYSDFVSKWLFEIFDGVRGACVYNHCRSVTITETRKEAGITDIADKDRFVFGQSPSETFASATESYQTDELLEALAAFKECLVRGSEPPVTARDGTRATILAEMIAASVKSGRPQHFDQGGCAPPC